MGSGVGKALVWGRLNFFFFLPLQHMTVDSLKKKMYTMNCHVLWPLWCRIFFFTVMIITSINMGPIPIILQLIFELLIFFFLLSSLSILFILFEMNLNQFNYQRHYYYMPNQSSPNSENSQNPQYCTYPSPPANSNLRYRPSSSNVEPSKTMKWNHQSI